MQSILVVVSPRYFRDEELFIPLGIWRSRLDVWVTSTRRGTARGTGGRTVDIPVGVLEIAAGRFDAVAVIGGIGAPRYLWDSGPVANAVIRVARRGGLVTAICYGVVVLARAGLLAGRRATGYPDPLVDLELRRGGARVTTGNVVVDDGVVSANGPEAATSFSQAVLSGLTS